MSRLVPPTLAEAGAADTKALVQEVEVLKTALAMVIEALPAQSRAVLLQRRAAVGQSIQTAGGAQPLEAGATDRLSALLRSAFDAELPE